MGIIWIAWVVWIFYDEAQPVITYEQVMESGMPLSPMCPGQTYQFVVAAVARKAPAVVAVTENWVSSTDSRKTVLDGQPEWRIIAQPVDGEFIVTSQVPAALTAGEYRYLRALGLSNPFILELQITVLPKDRCP